jgi:hypothetical protein
MKMQAKSLRVEKPKIMAVALVSMLAMVSALFVTMPSVNAANIPTYAFIAVSPNPIEVNQQASIIIWLDKINPTASGPQGGRFEGLTVTITKPDSGTEKLGPFTADPASYAYTSYTPNQIGTYTLEVNFPGQQVTGIGGLIPVPINDYYEASSFTTTLTVQEEPIPTSPQVPLPTEYWTRPIDAQNQEWYTISGDWLGIGGTTFGNTAYNATGNFNPYSNAPNSAHIVWTKPILFGGLVGGEAGGTSTSNYYTGKSYEPMFTPPVIINGVLYYNAPLPPKEGFYAVDLRTGETLWWQNSTGSVTTVGAAALAGLGTLGYAGISCGQVFRYSSPNEEGGRAYLWYMGATAAAGVGAGQTTEWYMYDANTGQLILTFQNATIGGTRVEGPNGELLLYFLDGTNNWLEMWNSTLCIGTGAAFSTGLWTWRPPVGATLDWRAGIQWNVTVPPVYGQAIYSVNSGIIFATTGNFFLPMNWQMEIGYDANTGTRLWIQNRTLNVGTTSYGLMGTLTDGVYTEYHKETMQWFGYDASTGNIIWGPSEANTNAWGSQQQAVVNGYGNFYAQAIDGIHAFDLKTGKKLWDFYGDSSGYNFPGFATYPFLGASPTLADGKIFAATGNSHGDPLFRGARLYGINATSGEEVWKIGGFYLGTMPVADGYLVAFNGYDNSLYCFGKGQTATAVAASPKISVNGDSVLIEGTVTDQSAGAKGTPAMSDASMSAWMEYLYMQQSRPTNATGVDVTLDTLDPNGNFVHIDTVTSDASGGFKKMWTPEVPGEYTVIATFAGSESYWPSYAQTYIGVGEAPPATAPPEYPQPIDNTMTIVGTGIAIIIAVAIVGILILRKK